MAKHAIADLIAFDAVMHPIDVKRCADEATAEVFGLTTPGCAWVEVHTLTPHSINYRLPIREPNQCTI